MIFENATEFSLYIEELSSNNRMTHIDAVLFYCKENFVEPEEIAPLISPSLKDKIAMNMRADRQGTTYTPMLDA
jgi:hypothetical protein